MRRTRSMPRKTIPLKVAISVGRSCAIARTTLARSTGTPIETAGLPQRTSVAGQTFTSPLQKGSPGVLRTSVISHRADPRHSPREPSRLGRAAPRFRANRSAFLSNSVSGVIVHSVGVHLAGWYSCRSERRDSSFASHHPGRASEAMPQSFVLPTSSTSTSTFSRKAHRPLHWPSR